ncbi:plancitoxin-1-like [Amphiura filiformis]|uniref:plancitoxin-1-like n=1 Tax=Amphiura filiformis TaxID=82378 RepID=UPI003B21ADAD
MTLHRNNMADTLLVFTLYCIIVVWCDVSNATVQGTIQCLDMDKNPVDWFIAYKLPKNANFLSGKGADFLYMDSNKQMFKKSSVPLDNVNQAIGFTLQQIYGRDIKSQNFAYGMYNDQPPPRGKSVSKGGHTKGVVALDSSTGFWLVHSVPNFTFPYTLRYKWPDNARSFGQTFLCMSLGYDQFEDIGKQLMYNCLNTYDFHMPDFTTSLTSLRAAIIKDQCITTPPWNSTTILTTIGGQSFYSFAKSDGFDADLYSDWLAPYFGSDLYVETWMRAGKLPSSCTGQYKVMNVEMVKLPGVISFKSTTDHSKWAVTQSSKYHPWTCIGDINREESQRHRAGGTVCMVHHQVWKVFSSAVDKYKSCPTKK